MEKKSHISNFNRNRPVHQILLLLFRFFLVVLRDVEGLLDVGRNRPDDGLELVFYFHQIKPVLVSYEVHCESQVAESTGSSNSVEDYLFIYYIHSIKFV